MERVCKKCGDKKSIDEFGRNRSHSGGYICKQCRKIHLQYTAKQYRRRHKVMTKQIRKRHSIKYSEEIKQKRLSDTENLSINYLIQAIIDTTALSRTTIKQYPELIEAYRMQLKIKRLTKTNVK